MVSPFLSGTPALVTVTSAHSVKPGGLVLVAIFSFGVGLTGVGPGHFIPIVPTLACLGETAVWVLACPMGTVFFAFSSW